MNRTVRALKRTIPRTSVPAENFVQIQQLLARCAAALDMGDLGTWVACFAKDGEFGSAGADEAVRPAFLVQGHDALLEQARLMTSGPVGYHWNADPVLELTDEGMSGLSFFMFVLAPEGRGEIAVAGHYVDDYVHRDGSWLIARRIVHTSRDFNQP